MSIYFRSLCIIVLVFGVAACAASNWRVIKNDELDHFDYDHLNWNTINQLPESTHFYVPLRLEGDVPARFPSATGMDWYTQDTLGDLSIYFLPANHRPFLGFRFVF
jgi:hypothetical protein